MHHLPISLYHTCPGVFYTSQEEVKFRGYEISYSMWSSIGVEISHVQIHFCNIYWHRHLWNTRKFLTPESFNQVLDGKNVFSPRFVDGTWSSNQLAGLGYGRKRLCDRFNTELSSVAVIPVPHSDCKAGEYDGPLAGCNIVEVGFDIALFAVAGPSLPIFPLLWKSAQWLHWQFLAMQAGYHTRRQFWIYPELVPWEILWERKLHLKSSNKFGLIMKEFTIFKCPGWDISHCVVFARNSNWYQGGCLAESLLDVQES